ncbi:hypothetical protein SPRG_14045 [Saprolegnia parasitica CBS 223.65]|uniref:THH1/TOM1/TOM3 domain-containing protein n=1 Tax=Saprolegnia parasitica (strain CBS 223.65) TaxID=695850 RepID=A0A067BRR5_SAPPC|nr:hypothetical protein SPRG_14045 [Saprolegnia parasitica CBS 223.65]KDO20953.1 hypothetical protein SPRG_14045 [Saprolegnia parasitica CBS 223.65]|eukprot:XP_012208343.1 hypothetical protein SPRG_14045 [Saprolegnia parasitica CBS 223.65]
MNLDALPRAICLVGYEHCIHVTSTEATCATMYLLALAWIVTTSIHRSRNLLEHGHATPLLPVRRLRWFPTLLTGAFACRAAWFILLDVHAFEAKSVNGTFEHTYVYNPFFRMDMDLFPLGVALWEHIATLLYVSAFTILLRFYDDMRNVTSVRRATCSLLDMTTADPIGMLEESRWRAPRRSSKSYVVVINVWMYLVEAILFLAEVHCRVLGCIELTTSRWKTLLPMAKTNLLNSSRDVIESLFYFVLACLLVRGAYRLKVDLQSFELSPLAQSLGARVWWLGLTCGVSFLFKSVTGLVLYTLPEILPAVIVVAMMRVHKYLPPARRDDAAPSAKHSCPAACHEELLTSPPFKQSVMWL